MLSTELTRTFGLKHPIVSAPMANWSGGVLAGVVSAGGGLGMIGVGSATPEDWIAEQANLARPHGPLAVASPTELESEAAFYARSCMQPSESMSSQSLGE